jgi:hexosaminidase
MSHRFSLCWMALLVFAAAFAAVARAEEPAKEVRPPAIVPKPVSLEVLEGKAFEFDADTLILAPSDTENKSSQQASDTIQKALGFKPAKQPKSGSSAKTLSLSLADIKSKYNLTSEQSDEYYSLSVSKDGGSVLIVASHPHGLFNGVQTFVQLADKGADGKWRVPAVKIEDYPRFRWRGYMLDTVRHFRPKAEVLRYIDLLAMHKMNVFHLHLDDDQGWRIEIKRYPKLVEVGAHVPNFSGQKGEDWFYTQADIKEIVAYAAARYITVVPEIEMPSHSTAATTSYPELSCDGKPSVELCAGKESTYEFMANVLDEVVELFPSPFVHIGADEVQPDHWRACPVCKKRMDELVAAKLPEGVEVYQFNSQGYGVPPNEDITRLQGEFVRKIDRHLTEKGKRMIGWDEILAGGLDKKSPAAIMAWRNQEAIDGAVKLGRDVVASVCPVCYLDYDLPLEANYAVEPAPASMPEEQAKHVLGIQGNMWGERTPTQERVDRQTFPRLCAIAEIGWTPRADRDFKDFSARLKRHGERLSPYGISVEPKAAK